jgi:hypothetical protein
MSRRLVLLALILLLFSASGGAGAAAAGRKAPAPASPAVAVAPVPSQGGCFVAGLNGKNETPPSGSDATGFAGFVLAPADPMTTTRKLNYYIAFTTLLGPETQAHIHRGAPGVAGPVVVPLPLGSPISGTITLTSTADLLAGLLYVNIHSGPKPDGEIRGQILPGGGCFSAALNGTSETPSNSSPGTGTGIFLLVPPDPVTTTQKLIYHIEFTGTLASETMAHIHKGAPGVSGGVLISLPLGKQKDDVLSLNAQTVSDLLAGLLYVDIHTGIVVNGELRGQIMPLGGRCYTATLTGANENPPNNSTATGYGFFTLLPSTLMTTTLQLSYQISFTKILSETGKHIQKGAPGINGNTVIVLPLGSPRAGVIGLTQQQAINLMSGLYYLNIQSQAFTQGQIRGQIVQTRCSTLFAPLITHL